jgi:hypothetical protein
MIKAIYSISGHQSRYQSRPVDQRRRCRIEVCYEALAETVDGLLIARCQINFRDRVREEERGNKKSSIPAHPWGGVLPD